MTHVFVVQLGAYNFVWTYVCKLQVFMSAELIFQ